MVFSDSDKELISVDRKSLFSSVAVRCSCRNYSAFVNLSLNPVPREQPMSVPSSL